MEHPERFDVQKYLGEKSSGKSRPVSQYANNAGMCCIFTDWDDSGIPWSCTRLRPGLGESVLHARDAVAGNG